MPKKKMMSSFQASYLYTLLVLSGVCISVSLLKLSLELTKQEGVFPAMVSTRPALYGWPGVDVNGGSALLADVRAAGPMRA